MAVDALKKSSIVVMDGTFEHHSNFFKQPFTIFHSAKRSLRYPSALFTSGQKKKQTYNIISEKISVIMGDEC